VSAHYFDHAVAEAAAQPQESEERSMSKGQRGNKEAKKPKQAPPDRPVLPTGALPAPIPAAPARFKKR
jgi:hypothetical protein